jgi:hypothetical protein
MRSLTSLFSTTVLAVALLSSPRVSGPSARASQEDVLTHPARIGDVPLPAFSAFERALQVSGVPGGLAIMEGCSDQREPMVHPHGTTLREVLNSISSGDPCYLWRMHDGVVNLEPLKGVPALLKDLRFAGY